MKRMIGRRAVAALLALMLSVMPVSAYAALRDDAPAYNEEILSALEQIAGSEAGGKEYYAALQKYDLLDEDGDPVESWSIRMEGKKVTLEELRALLSGDYDEDELVFVGQQSVTLGELDTILQIEDYLAHLRETYFEPKAWTQEQLDSFDSLVAQINETGIEISSAAAEADAEETSTISSGVQHSARVSVTAGSASGTFAVSLTGAAEGQEVSFTWTALSASQEDSGSGTVTLTAGADGTDSSTISVTLAENSALHSSAAPVYHLKLDDIQNALFSNGSEAMSVQATATAPVSEANMPTGVQTVSRVLKTTEADSITDDPSVNGSTMFETQLIFSSMGAAGNALLWKLPSKVKISGTSTLLAADDTTRSTDSWQEQFKGDGQYYGYARLHLYNGSSESSEIVGLDCGYPLRESGYPDPETVVSLPTAVSGENNKEEASLTTQSFGTYWTLKGAFPMVALTKRTTGSDTSYEVHYRAYRPLTVTLTLTDATAPTVTAISAPKGAYYPGQTVPVTVTFSEPVNAANATVKFSNDENTGHFAAEKATGGYSNKLTFLYTVKGTDAAGLSVTGVTATDTSGNELKDTYDTQKTVTGVTLQTPFRSAAIDSITAALSASGDALDVSVQISKDKTLTAWLAGDMQSTDGGFTPESLKAYYGGKEYDLIAESDTNITGGTLTASLPIDRNTSEAAKTHVVELKLGGSLLIGRYAAVTEPGVTYVTAEDLTATLDILTSTGTKYVFADAAAPTITVGEDTPTIQPFFTLKSGTYTYGDTAKTTVKGAADEEEADFVWASSNEAVAKVQKNGGSITVVPTGQSGTAQITLTARNGGSKAATVTASYDIYVQGDTGPEDSQKGSSTLTFKASDTSFLTIPVRDVFMEDGQSLTLHWTSNLTAFTVTAARGETTKTYTATGTSVTIPGGDLKYDYKSGGNTLTVTVSATSDTATYSDTATIHINASPAQVALEPLETYYVLDTAGTVPIKWSVENLDRAQSGDCFKLLITRDGEKVAEVTDKDSSSYSLTIPKFTASTSDPTSYRQVYTVTVQARNGTDSSWSYDSFLLYVYDADALKLMVNGKEAGDERTLSNREKVSHMSQAQLLALGRDIYLKDIISVNYGEYAWSELADQIAWSSSSSTVASVNYPLGSSYADIDRLSTASYRPTSEFGLSGLTDGTTTVTATHKLTGMADRVDVGVETLKDRLYLFQTYPQAETTLTFQVYTNAGKTATEPVTTQSDATGAAAYYAEYGIASDVYFQTTAADGHLYTGTYYLEALESGEGDWTQLERYPCNTLQLRRAAYAYLYLKDPDGTPYTGKVTFRGGVYVNGTYQQSARFGLNSTTADQKGDEDTTVTLGADGRLEVVMDPTQWDLPNKTLSANDSISYVFEISQSGDGCYPVFVTIDATVNEAAYVGSGEAVVTFRKNPEAGKHPFIAAQTVQYSDYGTPTSLLDCTDTIGPGTTLPSAELSTTVLWWGEEKSSQAPNRLQLYLADSRLPLCSEAGTYEQSSTAYPFSDCVVTTYTVTLDQTSLTGLLDTGKEAGLVLEYYRDGATLARQETLPFRLCSMIGAQSIETDSSVRTQILAMTDQTDTNSDDLANLPEGSGITDTIVLKTLQLLVSDDYDTSVKNKVLSVQVAPTASPNRFLALLQLNIGTMSSWDEHVTGVYSTSETGDSLWYKNPFRLGDVMRLTGVWSTQKWQEYNAAELQKVEDHDAIIDFDYQFGGWMECYIEYNAFGKWEFKGLSGKFALGGGVNATWLWNVMAGPVPLTFSIKVGGTAEVTCEAVEVSYRNTYEGMTVIDTDTDWLTKLRLYFYVGAFGGVGVDLSLFAAKVGIYGQLNFDLIFEWLRRPYLDDR